MEVSIEEFTTHYPLYMNLAFKKCEEIIITKGGKPIAKFLPLEGVMPPNLKSVKDTSLSPERKDDHADLKWGLPPYLWPF